MPCQTFLIKVKLSVGSFIVYPSFLNLRIAYLWRNLKCLWNFARKPDYLNFLTDFDVVSFCICVRYIGGWVFYGCLLGEIGKLSENFAKWIVVRNEGDAMILWGIGKFTPNIATSYYNVLFVFAYLNEIKTPQCS